MQKISNVEKTPPKDVATLDEKNLENVRKTMVLDQTIMKYLYSAGIQTASVDWPWSLPIDNIKFVAWLFNMALYGQLDGFVGFDINFRSNWEYDFICSALETNTELRYCARDLFWIYRNLTLLYKNNLFPVVIYPTLEPVSLETVNCNTYTLQQYSYRPRGLKSLFGADVALHDRTKEDTAMASQRSSLGINEVRADAKALPDANTAAALATGQATNPNFALKLNTARIRDLEEAQEVDSALFRRYDTKNSAEGRNNWQPSFSGTGVEHTVIPPPRSNIMATISLERNTKETFMTHLLAAASFVKLFLEKCIHKLYDVYFKPEMFYDHYLRIYKSIVLEFQYYTKTKVFDSEEVKITTTDKIIHFRDDLLRWYTTEYLAPNTTGASEDAVAQKKKKKQKIENKEENEKDEETKQKKKVKKSANEEPSIVVPAPAVPDLIELEQNDLFFIMKMDDSAYKHLMTQYMKNQKNPKYNVQAIVSVILLWLDAKIKFCQQEIENAKKKKNVDSKPRIKWEPANATPQLRPPKRPPTGSEEDDMEEQAVRDLERKKDN